MKITYLHGLLSNNQGEKNNWLRTVATETHDPAINYREERIFEKIYKEVEAFNPDVIIGSSIGGYFAYLIGRYLGIETLLFNPALHYRSYQPDMSGNIKIDTHTPRTHIVFGKNDDLIPPEKTIEFIEDYVTYKMYEHGHRTPYEVFTKEIEDFIK